MPVIEHGRFFLPGPTEVRPQVLEAMSRPVISHRSAEMEEIMDGVQRRLPALFGTARPVYTVSASGTGTMEMAVRNGTVARVLSIVSGGFGERFASICEECDRDVTRLVVPPGESVNPQDVEDALSQGEYDAVTLVHSESSTGALADVAEIAAAVRRSSDALILVDGVTSIGGMQVKMDAWGVDFYFTGSQKALALPPGLAFAAASARLLERAETLRGRGTYLDVLKHQQFHGKRQSPVTPPVSLIYALEVQLEGVEQRAERHAAMRRLTVDWASRADRAGLGVCLFTRSAETSPTITCLSSFRRSGSVVHRMREQGFVLGGGYGELAPTTFRIGHMGDHTPGGVEEMLEVLEGVLRTLK
jgi:aspartate aminotransferase-like enzyme